MKTARPASEARSSGSSERISRQLAVTLTAKISSHWLRFDVAERRHRPEGAGVADENVELAPALVRIARAEPVERIEILDVARHQGRLAAVRADCIVEIFERALGAGQRDDVGAGPGELKGDGAADAARGARHEGDAALKGSWHDGIDA